MIWDFKDFNRSEFVCKHCGRLPEIAEIHYIGLVMYFLQPLRTDVKAPIYVHSGYRCPEHNRITPGAHVMSYHTIPEKPTFYHPCAVDIHCDIGYTIFEVRIIEHVDLNYCGHHRYINDKGEWYIHVDFRGYKARW